MWATVAPEILYNDLYNVLSLHAPSRIYTMEFYDCFMLRYFIWADCSTFPCFTIISVREGGKYFLPSFAFSEKAESFWQLLVAAI